MSDAVFPEAAAARSAVYRVFAEAFTYRGAEASPYAIDGAAFNEAFEPAIGKRASSLRERSYVSEDQGTLFEDLTRFYDFFGLGRREDAEMPDHVSIELEFMHFLTHLETLVAPRPGDLASLRRAQRDFLSRHLVRLLRGVAGKLDGASPGCQALVAEARAFVEHEAARLAEAVA